MAGRGPMVIKIYGWERADGHQDLWLGEGRWSSRSMVGRGPMVIKIYGWEKADGHQDLWLGEALIQHEAG